jgi:photosystem II stability/assembly factor-like uncharacterized protein
VIPFILFVLLLIVVIGLSSKNTDINSHSGWVLQTNLQSQLRGRTISDMTFTDSVTGYAVTPWVNNDSAFIFKTTNGGDNWFAIISNSYLQGGFNKIKFINKSTGFTCGSGLRKTTDAGNNWFVVVPASSVPSEGMYILNEDTIYTIDHNGLTGGVFRTTNGGQNWEQLYFAGNDNPSDIYMYNVRIGFYHGIGFFLYKTTNGGYNWSPTDSGGFNQMYFLDSLTGYRAYSGMKKTTNGGYNWINQMLPSIPNGTNSKSIIRFQLIGIDTIWGVGSSVQFHNPNRDRGIISKTTNGGINWGYQIPDTNIVQIPRYYKICFIGNKFGWAYNNLGLGVHTTTGGDSTIYTNINENNFSISNDYILFQNYPNPFNPVTKINYELPKDGRVKLVIYDILGREIKSLVNNEFKQAGRYTVEFKGTQFASGVYFYRIQVEGGSSYTAVKKMLMVK